MIVKLTKATKYVAEKHIFDTENPEKQVTDKLGKYLVSTGYFEEIPEEKADPAKGK